jgi:hypothetical protein
MKKKKRMLCTSEEQAVNSKTVSNLWRKWIIMKRKERKIIVDISKWIGSRFTFKPLLLWELENSLLTTQFPLPGKQMLLTDWSLPNFLKNIFSKKFVDLHWGRRTSLLA